MSSFIGPVRSTACSLTGSTPPPAVAVVNDGRRRWDGLGTGCQLIVAALGEADRDSAQAMIDDALDNSDESNIVELRDAAGDVRFAATADNDILGRSGMAVIDSKCREHFADGWNE